MTLGKYLIEEVVHTLVGGVTFPCSRGVLCIGYLMTRLIGILNNVPGEAVSNQADCGSFKRSVVDVNCMRKVENERPLLIIHGKNPYVM